MGVRCYLKSAIEEQLLILRRDPSFLPVFFGEEDEEEPSFWRRLFRRPRAIPTKLLEQTDCMETDLDKTWHGLHFIFTGTEEGGDLPAAFLFKGGVELGSFGARAVSVAEARLFKAFLHSLSEDDLRSRFDPDRMTLLEIYPDHIWKRNEEEALAYLLEYFEFLQAFTRDVVDENQGFVLWIT